MATAIDIMNAAANEVGLPTVPQSSGTGDTLGIQTLALLNALGNELVRVHDWQFLEKRMTFTGDGILDTFPLPPDFQRQVNQTQWSTSQMRPMKGPTSPQVWSWLQFGLVSVGIFFRYRILGNQYTVFPVPGIGEVFDLYYIGRNWVIDQDDPLIFKDNVTKPGDIPLFDPRLMISGLKVKLWAAKGFDTTVLQNEFNFTLTAEKGQNQGAKVIDLCGYDPHIYITTYNLPDSGYGL